MNRKNNQCNRNPERVEYDSKHMLNHPLEFIIAKTKIPKTLSPLPPWQTAYFLSSKLVPRYTFLTISSLARSSPEPDLITSLA